MGAMGNTKASMSCVDESFISKALGPTTALAFASGDSAANARGPFIGNAGVNTVPLPSSFLLLVPGLFGLTTFRKCLRA